MDFVYAILTLIMGIALIIASTVVLKVFAIALGVVMITDGVLGLVALVLSFALDRKGVSDADCVVDAETVNSVDADDYRF